MQVSFLAAAMDPQAAAAAAQEALQVVMGEEEQASRGATQSNDQPGRLLAVWPVLHWK